MSLPVTFSYNINNNKGQQFSQAPRAFISTNDPYGYIASIVYFYNRDTEHKELRIFNFMDGTTKGVMKQMEKWICKKYGEGYSFEQT